MKILYILLSISITTQLFGQDEEITFTLDPLTEHIYMLTGRGGNIGVFKNEKGLFIIDDQFAKVSDKILNKLKTTSNQPVTMVINTHFHGDHTGGNENMSLQGATIFAQKNVRYRMQNQQKEKGSLSSSSLPIITFDEGLQFYFENENVQAFHVHDAHTDGDSLIYFAKGNVLHMGDTFFNGRYPYIDLKSGGTIKGYIAATEKALMIINEDTKIIPGHGKLGNKKDLETFLKMLKTITATIQKEIDAGKSKMEIINNPALTAAYDDLGYGNGYINPEKMRTTIYKSLTQSK